MIFVSVFYYPGILRKMLLHKMLYWSGIQYCLLHGIKGNVPFHAPGRAAFVKLSEKNDEDDD